MDNEIVPLISKYITTIARYSELKEPVVEKIINTQIALILGDLAVQGESYCWLGKFQYQDQEKGQEITFIPNDFILDIISGKIDPAFILKEIIENV